MYFNSLTYFLFLPAVYLLFLVAGAQGRWIVLLLASFIFYAALRIPYLVVIFCMMTAVAYYWGLLSERSLSETRKRALLWSGIILLLLPLLALRYLPLIWNGLHPTGGAAFTTQALAAIGVSYYTFQSVSYLVDLYLEKIEAEHHLGYFALYMGFFPKMLQGPIERAGELLPQFKSEYTFQYDNMRHGLLLFAWGLFKKVVVANRLEGYINLVYGDLPAYGGWSLIIATWCYAMQIYCDFSGYTDMALGSARLFNIRLTDNFRNPYAATSVMDFWRRWHISFSRALLDYLFKPLQMKLRNWREGGTALALLATFFISGIWHGASWCFVIWGLVHGVYLAAAVFWRPVQKKLVKKYALLRGPWMHAWKIFFTFNLVCLAWIFFRSHSLSDASYILSHLFAPSHGLLPLIQLYDNTGLLLVAGSIAAVLWVESWSVKPERQEAFFRMPVWLRWSLYYALIFAIILFNMDSTGAFIYVRF